VHYHKHMAAVGIETLGIARRVPHIAEIDQLASELGRPYAVITADCSNPCEIDDAISVEALPSEKELYRVRVFAADTSGLYTNEEVARAVVQRTESRYFGSGTAEESYEPMIEPHHVQRIHFEAGRVRSALVTSFIVGEDVPPTETSVEFGDVEVVQNLTYARFGEKCRYSPGFEPFGRAAALIIHHLAPAAIAQEYEDIYRNLIHVPSAEKFKRGAMINAAFMVAGNTMAGQLIASEPDSVGIYRIHDPDNPQYAEIFDPRVAWYSTTPGPHTALGVDSYMRITSGLRRAEDFMMHGILRARKEKRPLTGRDHKLVRQTVQRLNQRVVKSVHDNTYRTRDQDRWLPRTT
jgi:hypothetical protein